MNCHNKLFIKKAIEILSSERDPQNEHLSRMIGNIKELKQDIIDAIQEERQKILRKRSAQNARMNKEKIERRNRARNT